MDPWPRAHRRSPATRRRILRAARSTVAVAAALVAVVALVDCLGPGRACTQIGGTDLVFVDVAPEVRVDLATIRVELCQSERCGDVTFSTVSPSEYGIYIESGVSLFENTYLVELRVLGKDWDPDDTARVSVSGASADGTEVVRRREFFEFDKSYPNGKGCEPETLGHEVRVGDTDRTG